MEQSQTSWTQKAAGRWEQDSFRKWYPVSSLPSDPLLNMGHFIFTKSRRNGRLGGSGVIVADVRLQVCLFGSVEHALILNSSALTCGTE